MMNHKLERCQNQSHQKKKKGFNWGKLIVGALAVVVTVAVVAAIAVASPVGGAVVACAVLDAVVSASVDVGCQLATNGGDISKVDPYQTVIVACCGALSGAFAATPIGVEGQIAINGAIGGTQSALNGGDVKDIAKGIDTGISMGSKFVKEKYNEIIQRKEEVPNAN